MIHFKQTLQANTSSSADYDMILYEIGVVKHDIHIAIMCETWLRGNTTIIIKHYNLASKTRADGNGSVGISLEMMYYLEYFQIFRHKRLK